MKLYLSSIQIPRPDLLAALIGKPLNEVHVALIGNANDFYNEGARALIVASFVNYLQELGLKVTTLDLRNFSDAKSLTDALSGCDLIWAMGGNTFCLRYEMRRSGFEGAIKDLLAKGVVYGGDSAGALVAGSQIGGIGVELADNLAFAKELIHEGLGLVPYIPMPHVDNPEFAEVTRYIASLPEKYENMIELKDSQAAIFENGEYRIVES